MWDFISCSRVNLVCKFGVETVFKVRGPKLKCRDREKWGERVEVSQIGGKTRIPWGKVKKNLKVVSRTISPSCLNIRDSKHLGLALKCAGRRATLVERKRTFFSSLRFKRGRETLVNLFWGSRAIQKPNEPNRRKFPDSDRLEAISNSSELKST